MMRRLPRTAALAAATLLALSLGACSKNEGAAAAPNATPVAAGASPAPTAVANAYEAVAARGKGFTVGAMMSAQPVYVLFDPQCPHCGRLWQASHPLLDRVKFVWIPVAFNAGKSLPQGAALLAASDAVATMDAHEAALLGGQGGLQTSQPASAEAESTIRANTQLLTDLGADSVPYVVIKNRHSGEVIAQAGALPTAELAKRIGLD